MSMTLKEHLARAGAFAGLIKKHQADLADLSDDVPKAIAIAQDFHELFKEQNVKAPATPVASPAPKPAAPPAAPRVTAAHAAQHVKEKGLSEAERAAFERASQSVG